MGNFLLIYWPVSFKISIYYSCIKKSRKNLEDAMLKTGLSAVVFAIGLQASLPVQSGPENAPARFKRSGSFLGIHSGIVMG